MKYRYLFGPVHSRRLGISLGVDMVPFKTCSFNCIYCECGKTTNLTQERKEYVPVEDLKTELRHFLSKDPKLDYVTFAGSGEPTLHTGIGEVIRFVKESFPQYKTAILTNGSLLHLQQVREAILPCDLVKPSLDAVSEDVFYSINRPHCNLHSKTVIDGLIQFSKEYHGALWVEVFIAPGINDNKEELKLIKETLQKINPTRVQLNSLDRPGAVEWITPAEINSLKVIAEFLKPLVVEIVSRKNRKTEIHEYSDEDAQQTILSLLRRRPSTIEELSVIAGLRVDQIYDIITKLTASGEISEEAVGKKQFFRLRTKKHE
ncbi:MAG TPA: radical SAM protein [Chitinispirillaceae bacterium]|nr:radical SAM protein [Chitinispirillaceae bacterium]